MHQRSISAVILLLALLTGAAGNVLAAAFCPSFGRPHANCGEMVGASGESHSGMTHEMHGMEMSEMSIADEQIATNSPTTDLNIATEERTDEIAQPLDDCIHCITRSNLPRSAVALSQASTFQSASHVDEPEAIKAASYPDLVPRVVNAREHAPPAQSSPLYVRLNVFRI